MQHPMIYLNFALAALMLANPARALTTTYDWDNFAFGASECIFDPDFAAVFPELCGDETTGLLSVAFVHDEPIWDNDASGCDPDVSQEGCNTTEFDRILRITLSGVAVFEASEVSSFSHVDFLGRCPGICERSPPIISFEAADALTGLDIAVRHDRESLLHSLRLIFPDGRTLRVSFADWTNRRTVAEPGTFVPFVFALAGLGFAMRRKAPLAARP